MNKVCSKCKESKDMSLFSKDKSRKDGLCCRCKECKSEYYQANREHILEQEKQYHIDYNYKIKEYYQDNRDIILEKKRQYNKENADARSQYNKQYYRNNTDKLKEYQKQYIKDNTEKIAERYKQYSQDNKDKIKEWNRQYRINNAEEIANHKRQECVKKERRQRENSRRQNDEQYRITKILRGRLRSAIKYNFKFGSAIDDLGCSVEFLLEKMERDLGRKHTKDDQIDHILPFHLLDMSQIEHQRIVCHYTNLRWLPAKENKSRDYTDIVDNKEVMKLIWYL